MSASPSSTMRPSIRTSRAEWPLSSPIRIVPSMTSPYSLLGLPFLTNGIEVIRMKYYTNVLIMFIILRRTRYRVEWKVDGLVCLCTLPRRAVPLLWVIDWYLLYSAYEPHVGRYSTESYVFSVSTHQVDKNLDSWIYYVGQLVLVWLVGISLIHRWIAFIPISSLSPQTSMKIPSQNVCVLYRRNMNKYWRYRSNIVFDSLAPRPLPEGLQLFERQRV